jgi:hypothetical protein
MTRVPLLSLRPTPSQLVQRISIDLTLSSIPTWAYLLVIISAIGLFLPLAVDFGKAWDVQYCEDRAQAAYTFYFDGFNGAKYLNTPLPSPHYGPIVDILIKVFQDTTADVVRKFEIRVLIQAAISLSALIPVFLIGVRIVSKPLALIAVALVAATPAFFGNAFINPKDGIFASGFLWTLYVVMACFDDGRRPSNWALIGLGLLLGVVTSIRYASLYLILVALFAAILFPALRPPQEVKDRVPQAHFGARLWRQTRLQAVGLALLLLSSSAAYVLSMPLILAGLQTGTLAEIIRNLDWVWTAQVWYFGKYIWAQRLPWHYVYGYMLVQLPLYYHVFLFTYVMALVASPRTMMTSLQVVGRRSYRACSTLLILSLAVIIPVIVMLLGRPLLYDSFRHVLFLVPLICVMFYFAFLQAIRSLPGVLRISMCLIAVVVGSEAIITSKKLHPYEYVYFNPLVRGNENLFDLEYHTTSYRELARHLNEYARGKAGDKIRLWVDEPVTALTTFLDTERFELVAADDAPQLIVGYNRWGGLEKVPKPWLASVKRGNMVFAAAGVKAHRLSLVRSCGQLPILTQLCLDAAIRRLVPQLQAHLAAGRPASHSPATLRDADSTGYDDSRSAPGWQLPMP